MRRSVPAWRLLLVIVAAVGQVACLRSLHQVSYIRPPRAPIQDETDEAESHRRSTEWYNRRHPDGGMRQKAVEDRQRLAGVTAGTSGLWNAIGPQPIQSYGSIYSGRVWGIAVDPRNSNVVYTGTDGGGVWKTTNGGTNWAPLTDSQANINIRDLTLAPSAPDTIFAATAGGGILKSTDDGATWTTLHPSSGDYVLSVAVHPTNASIVLAGGCGEVGRSADGGNTWSTKLTVQSGYCLLQQVVFDPTNGSIAYAGMGDGLHRSTDAGLTWSLVGGTGLPSVPFSYVTVAIAPSSSNILYLALKGSDEHLIGFYRSTNSGANWTQVGVPPNDDVTYWGWSLRVHPTNPNLIYAGSLLLSMSTDGGSTWTGNWNGLHVDHHVQTYSADGDTLYIGNDGGIWSTSTPVAANTSWTDLNNTLNTAMFYPGISISPTTLNTTFGGTQDNGVLQYQGSLAWTETPPCGDGGFTAIDFVQPQNVYAACQDISVHASTDGANSFHSAQSGINLQDQSDFIPPLVMDPSNSRRLYFGTSRLYQTADGANSWTAISPNLTAPLNLTIDIGTIAVAPSDPNTIYTGGWYGAVFITRNALSGTGATWTAVNLPYDQSLTQITVDPQNPLTAWAAVSGGAYNSEGPVYRTTNGGPTWTSLSTGLPNLTVNDLLLDPDIANTIYAATDVGVYRSVDGGQSWLPLGTGLPNVIVHSIRLDRPSRTLRAATYGRGMWDLSVPVSGQVAITIASSTPGAYFSLEDGSTHQAPVSFFWYTGAHHTVTWLSTAPGGAGTRYVFSGWADGVAQNARTITVPSSATTYTGNIGAQYLLTVTPSPALGGVVSLAPPSSDGYYNSGTSVQVSETTASGYGFWYLSGDLGGNLPQSITMNAPHSVTVNFYCQYNYNYLPYQLGSGQTSGFFQIATGAGCSWNLAAGATWFTVTPPTSGIGPATVAYSVAASTGANRSMMLTITGDANYSYQPSVRQDASATGRPTVVSVQPNSGSGTTQSFTYQFLDPNGYSKITWATMNFETTAYTYPSCEIAVSPYAGGSYVYLLSDSGSTWLGPVQVPGTSTLQNSQCSLDASKSSISGSGNLLTVTVAVTFKPAFFGVKLASAYAYDSVSSISSATEMLGTWTVGSAAPPTVVSGTPTSPTTTPQTFTFTGRDLDGYTDIYRMYFLINSNAAVAQNTCHGFYDRGTNALYLYNDTLTALQGPLTPGTSATLQNSQCVVSGSTSSLVSGSGTDLKVAIGLGLQGGYAGTNQNVYLWVKDNEGHDTGWVQTGTWNLAPPPIYPPTVVSGTPTSPTTTPQTFTFTGRDLDGYTDIYRMYFLINSNAAIPQNTCHGFYDRGTNALYLYNDTLTVLLGPLTPGTSGTLQNSQCAVSGSTSSLVSGSGTDLTVAIGLGLQGGYAGTNQNVYLWVKDNEGHDTGWVQTGTWNLAPPPTHPPTVVSGTPTSSTTTPQTFTFTGRDLDGYADIYRMYFLINSSAAIPQNTCHGFYDRGTNALYLYNDSLTVLLGPLTPGTSGALQNSQCAVSGSTSSLVSGSGTDLSVAIGLGLQGGYAGTNQNVYLWVKDNEGHDTGWVQAGTWNLAPPPTHPPTVVSGTPTSSTTTPQTFTFTGRDLDGYTDIYRMYFLVNSNATIPQNTCHGFYDRGTNALYLYNDTLTVLLGPLTPGTSGTLQNSQCVVSGSTSSLVSGSGMDLTVAIGLGLQGGYSGTNQNVYLWVKDNEGHDTGWVQTGTWNLAHLPTVVSGTPTSSTTTPQIFTFTGRDPDGYTDIYRMYFLVNSSAAIPQNTCHGFYDRGTNALYLYNDALTVLLGPLAPGTSGTLQNSQCRVSGSTSSLVSGSGTDLTVAIGLGLQGGYSGTNQNVYLWVKDNEGHDTGWVQTGTWNLH